MTNFYTWSTTAANNATAGTPNWAESQLPSTVNNSARDEMADAAKWREFLGGAKTTSGTDTITLTSGMTITAYQTDMMFVAKLGGTNTGAATLNIDSVGAAAVEIDGAAVGAGDLASGKYYLFVYDGTAFQATRLSSVSGYSDPLTTRGDLLYRNASATARLALGTTGYTVVSDGTDVAWGQLGTAGIADDAITGAKLGVSLVAGDVLYSSGTDTLARLAKGTDGEVLTLASGVPSWAAASGGMEFVEAISASASSAITFTHTVEAGYDYILRIRDVKNSGDLTEANAPNLQVGTGGGPTFQTSGYTNQAVICDTTAITAKLDSITTGLPLSAIGTTGGATAGETWNADVLVMNPGDNAETNIKVDFWGDNSAGTMVMAKVSGRRSTAEVVTALRVIPGTGTFTTGTFTLLRQQVTA